MFKRFFATILILVSITLGPAFAFDDPTPSVARLVISDKFGMSPDVGGTAFFVGFRTWITAGHVAAEIKAGKSAYVVLQNGSRRYIETVLWNELGEGVDIAAVLVGKPEFDVPPLALSCDPPQFGNEVAVAGYPIGVYSITFGRVGVISPPASNPHARPLFENYFQIGAMLNKGSSGSPVLDVETGAVVGVASSILAVRVSEEQPVVPLGIFWATRTAELCKLPNERRS